jgi:two-component system copper resistance phosphate regulon response regulator CusR
MKRLIVVEDDVTLRQSLQRGLILEGYGVITAATGFDGYQVAIREPTDAIILDLLLPDGNGLETLAKLRQNGFGKPILIVTARDAIEDRIIGLDLGADDYLVKPFAFGELTSRLRALLRRHPESSRTTLVVKDLEMNLVARQVVRSGRPINLTSRQFSVLEYLMRNQDQVVTREMLAQDVWRMSTATWTNVIEVQINQLRKKIERPGQKPLLHTIRKEGYVIGERP